LLAHPGRQAQEMLSDFPIFFDQKRDTTLKSIEIALAIILSPDKETALIAKRLDNAHLAGFWEFPGGKIETGESSEEAAVREAFEETGLKVTPIKKLTPVSYDYEYRISRGQFQNYFRTAGRRILTERSTFCLT
jgi:mutator protein MutT